MNIYLSVESYESSDLELHQNWDFFRLCPLKYVMLPPITEHVSLHGKSLCKIIARASGGANNMHPLICGGGAQTERVPKLN